MHLMVTGVRHRTAPIEVREQFALLEEEVAAALPRLLAGEGIHECAILTTCNRTELYLVVSDAERGMEAVRQFYRDFKRIEISGFRPYTFALLHEDAVMHLFRVASGLDSLILGEGQILGQVKEALAMAQNAKTTGIVLDRLFKTALTVGKRIRTETGIAEKDASVSRAAYEFARQMAPDLLDRRIALIGGGKMAEIMMMSLKRDMTPVRQRNVCIVNRSTQRLESLCERYGFAGYGWEQLDEAIENADVLFVATGAPHVVLGRRHFEGKGPKLVLDIAVPRNVDPRVSELSNIRLFNTDNLAGVGRYTEEAQALLKEQAQDIMEEEARKFQQWRIGLAAVSTISRLRDRMEAIRQETLRKVTLTGVDEEAFEALDAVSRSLVQRILHEPTVKLKTSASVDEVAQQAATLSRLFDIEDCPFSG